MARKNRNLNHYRGDTESYNFATTFDASDVIRATILIRRDIGGAIILACNSVDSPDAWDIQDNLIVLTLDHPDSPETAITTSAEGDTYIYDVQVTTDSEIQTVQYGNFTIRADVATSATDEDLPTVFSTAIVDALEAGVSPATANPFLTKSHADTLYAVIGAGGSTAWGDITDTPTTRDGYGITDVPLTSDLDVVAAAVAAEITARTNAINALTSALSGEATTRANADAALTSALAGKADTSALGAYGALAAANTWAQAQTFSGQALGASGTSLLPSFAFSTDPDTGFFRQGADQFGIATAGVIRASFATTGLALLYALTATVTDTTTFATTILGDWRHNLTSGTATDGFGIQHLYRLQSSTTANQTAAAMNVYWPAATHATRTSAIEWQGVYNATALAAWLRAHNTGAADSTPLWLLDVTAGTMKQVVLGAADSGGSGYKLLRVAN